MTLIERATQAAIAELHRQSNRTGCTTEDNGRWAQVDGSFEVEPVVRAIIAAIRQPSAAMERAWLGSGVESVSAKRDWQAMVDALLEEGS